MVFDAEDDSSRAIYRTNVLMCVATEFAMAGFELIPDHRRRTEIAQWLVESGRELIHMSADQVGNFAGQCARTLRA